MSRTIRRKNAWNKESFIKCDEEWLDHMSGMNPFPYIKFHRRKYNGCSHDQIKKRLNAKYHSDNMHYRESNRGVKEWGKWWVRFHMNQDLKKAVRYGEEDNLCLTEKSYHKAMNGWWLWWD